MCRRGRRECGEGAMSSGRGENVFLGSNCGATGMSQRRGATGRAKIVERNGMVVVFVVVVCDKYTNILGGREGTWAVGGEIVCKRERERE